MTSITYLCTCITCCMIIYDLNSAFLSVKCNNLLNINKLVVYRREIT
ncbi:hypothetical protein EC2762100_1662 [Escherichia coli 2762100]|nr:hypothetical protein EC2762100_1662 [Escherichia coli 2762100]